MRQSPLISGLIYLFLGILFTYFAVQDVQSSGWGIFSIMLVILATFDLGSGLKMLLFIFFSNKGKLK
jgi:hypothetical protein